MYVFAVPDDGVNTLRGRPCKGDLPDMSGLCFVFLVPELLVQRLAVLEYSPDERPETVMFLRGRELLAANDEQPIYLRSPRLQQNIQAAHVFKSMRFSYPNRGRYRK